MIILIVVEMLLIEIVDEDKESSFIVEVTREIEEFKTELPFETKLNVWKEEVYFTLPMELRVEYVYYRVRRGGVYYWPPGKAMCLFYGMNEPYTPVGYVGEYVGPLNLLKIVEDGDKATVIEHSYADEFAELAKKLVDKGYSVGTPIEEGIRVLVASKYLGSTRIAFTVYREEYGYHLQCETLYRYDESYWSMRMLYELKRMLRGTKYLRADLSEEGYATITAGVGSEKELLESIDELEAMYPRIINRLWKEPLWT